MKRWIIDIIDGFVREYEKTTITKWGKPSVGFASADDVTVKLPLIVDNHGIPQEALADASVVIAYYIPFEKSLAETNVSSNMASPEWARAYEETNAMLGEINNYLICRLKEKGYEAAVHPSAGSFDREKLISNWSHRHIAYLAGLGTFGVNNMLITESGCCGRFSTVVTNLDVVPDSPMEEELCKYKVDGSCGACMTKCPSGALTTDGFDRHKCYVVCMKNAEVYTDFGNSYDSEEKVGSEVCGKCIAGMPCAFL